MSKFLRDYASLYTAVHFLYRQNQMSTYQLAKATVPDAWVDRITVADEQAAQLDGVPLKQIVPDNEIDTELASGNDDALEVLVDSEDTLQLLIVMHTGCTVLHNVLNEYFEGELVVHASKNDRYKTVDGYYREDSVHK